MQAGRLGYEYSRDRNALVMRLAEGGVLWYVSGRGGSAWFMCLAEVVVIGSISLIKICCKSGCAHPPAMRSVARMDFEDGKVCESACHAVLGGGLPRFPL